MQMEIKRLALILFIIVLTSSIVSAGTVNWDSSGGGDWGNFLKWNPDKVPAQGDDVVINNAGAGTITVDSDATIKMLTVGGAHKVALSTHKLTINNALSTTGTFVKSVSFANPGTNDWPFAGDIPYRVMLLYRASEIKGSGWIRSLSFKSWSGISSAISCPNVTVKMGHTYLTNVNATFASNVEQGQGSVVTVINNATVNISAVEALGYYTVTLSTPFYYNGVDNLVIDVDHASACTGGSAATTIDTTVDYNSANVNFSDRTSLTGTPVASLPEIKFYFVGGDDSIRYTDDGTNSSVNASPFLVNPKIQLLYTAAEINGSGYIDGIGFPVSHLTRGGPVVASSYTVTVKLGHTSLTDLTGTFADNFNSGTPVTVANAVNFSIPAGVPDGGYVWMPLPDGTFYYNGTNNLVVQIEVTPLSGDVGWIQNVYSGTFHTRLSAGAGALTGTPDHAQYFIKFRFAGGTMGVITAENNPLSFPFDHALNNKQQFLYRAAELGTKGNITHVAYRLQSVSSTASTYGSFELILDQTTSTELGTTANMSGGAQTVYSGSVSIPAGLKAGDWIEIPLSTPYAYDGVSNLILQTSNLAGSPAADNLIYAENSGTRYPNRRAYNGGSNTADTSARDSILADIRLNLQ
jgi:hypothetical protein